MTLVPAKLPGTLLSRMAPDEKPYRVYRGGRVKGKVPAPTKQRPSKAPERRLRPPKATTRTRRGWRGRLRRPSWRRIVPITLLLLVVLVAVWGVTTFLAVRSGVEEANDRLQPGTRAVLAAQDGLLLSNPTTILLLGTDTGPQPGRAGLRHSDSIMLLRTDPDRNRLSYLSIPRDLLVPVPGLGDAKINAAYQAGGAPLAVRAVRTFTGEDVNHVVVVDFSNFEQLVDAVGGIEIDVPRRILSNPFDCPYDAERCRTWEGWRFAKGEQHMDGRRALVYSRIRKNQLDPAESDVTRAGRQQAVMQAVTAKLTSPGTMVRLPFKGDELTAPLATDLSAWQILQLGWVKSRASAGNTLYCRLGGDLGSSGGQSVIFPSEDNRNALAMWRGDSAAQPPTTTYGPGCRKGRPLR
jgi:LCP family protein required for cell wall assembly